MNYVINKVDFDKGIQKAYSHPTLKVGWGRVGIRGAGSSYQDPGEQLQTTPWRRKEEGRPQA